MFILIDRRTLIEEKVGSEVFLMKPKHQFIYTNAKNMFMVPNPKNKRDYYVNLCLSYLTDEV